MTEIEVVKLAGHETLDTITDREGFVWCIAGNGRQAALQIAPANLKGAYNWASSRALGQHVDLDLPPSAYVNTPNGPQHYEIYHYVATRLMQGYSVSPTVRTIPAQCEIGTYHDAGSKSTRQTAVVGWD